MLALAHPPNKLKVRLFKLTQLGPKTQRQAEFDTVPEYVSLSSIDLILSSTQDLKRLRITSAMTALEELFVGAGYVGVVIEAGRDADNLQEFIVKFCGG